MQCYICSMLLLATHLHLYWFAAGCSFMNYASKFYCIGLEDFTAEVSKYFCWELRAWCLPLMPPFVPIHNEDPSAQSIWQNFLQIISLQRNGARTTYASWSITSELGIFLINFHWNIPYLAIVSTICFEHVFDIYRICRVDCVSKKSKHPVSSVLACKLCHILVQLATVYQLVKDSSGNWRVSLVLLLPQKNYS